ncbi:hypothetical protein A6J60_008955 [Psychrobacter sp. FDAARGOS_221]|nr:hypothetical protein A6J60_008955 [Psychrobacter sp. FDAARGOS_221]
MIIAESQQQRHAFEDTFTQLGLSIVGCFAPEKLSDSALQYYAQQSIDLWLLDSDDNGELYQKLDQLLEAAQYSQSGQQKLITKPQLLIGFEQAPPLSASQPYGKWQRQLRRKLASLLNLPQLNITPNAAARYRPWRYVLLLVADSQHLEPVQALLTQLSAELPVSILLAPTVSTKGNANSGNINPDQSLHALPAYLQQDNDWRCQVINSTLNMQAGHCYIVPLTEQIVCDSTGRVIINRQQQGTLAQLFNNCSEVFGEQLIALCFTKIASDRQVNTNNGNTAHSNAAHSLIKTSIVFDAASIAAANHSLLWQPADMSAQDLQALAAKVSHLCQ